MHSLLGSTERGRWARRSSEGFELFKAGVEVYLGPEQRIIEISCLEVWRKISAYIDDDVDPVLRARLEFHFQRCKHCMALLEGTQNTIRLIGDEQAFDLPPGFGERLISGLARRIEEDDSETR